ncbi:MAG: DUF4157 domain-containing protein [Bacteroidales bacterium]|nr:DUF4157 domain-containing protein [Bacteroidales bacterium]
MSSSYRISRRHRSRQSRETEQPQPFFTGKGAGLARNNPENAPFFQAKLAIGQPGDKYEQEADTVANRVVSGQDNSTPVQAKEISTVRRSELRRKMEEEKVQKAAVEEEEPIQKKERKEEDEPVQMQAEEEEEPVQMKEKEEEEEPVQMQAEEEEEPIQMQKEEEEEPIQMQAEEEEEIQAKAEPAGPAASSNLSSRVNHPPGNGKPMAGNTRTTMEHAFGMDFSGVRIHTGTEAVRMNKELGAQAFTRGRDIYFNSGKYRPENSEGKRLLAHELTHVVQQSGELKTPGLQRQPTPAAILTAARFHQDPKLEAALQNKALIRKGAKGEHVSLLQKALIDDGCSLPKYGVDGDFGSETEAAVKAYQTKHHLAVDGIVGPETMGHLDHNFATTVVTDRYNNWYQEQIALYSKESAFPYHVAVMNVFYKTRNFHVIQTLNDIKYEVWTFTGAKDTWEYTDGRIEVTDLSKSLRGNTDRAKKMIRLNAKLKPLDAAMTLYHEMNHVTSKEKDYLKQEVESRVVTEQFAIDNNLPPTKKGYRTKDGKVDRAFIENEINSSQHYNPKDKTRIGRSYEGMNKIGPWTVPA